MWDPSQDNPQGHFGFGGFNPNADSFGNMPQDSDMDLFGKPIWYPHEKELYAPTSEFAGSKLGFGTNFQPPSGPSQLSQQYTAEQWHEMGSLLKQYKLTPATLYSKLNDRWIGKEYLQHASLEISRSIVEGDGRLIFSCPPRHGKSELSTVAVPIWILENFPNKRIIVCTYGASLSDMFGRSVRDYFVYNQGILTTKIRKDAQRVNHFYTDKGGQMVSVGIGGAVIGKGADVLIVDDYIKTIEEALSDTERERVWEWFMGTAYHRLEPGGTVIIVCTRWHRDDLSGRLLSRFPERWKHIRFTALAEENDVLGRKIGEPLFPERYSRENLLEKQDTMGKLYFAAIYQQDPESEDVRQTDRSWIELVDEAPNLQDPDIRRVRVWDFGGGKNKEYDPTVGLLMAVHMKTGYVWILDIYRKRDTAARTELKVKVLANVDTRYTKVLIEQEPGASGKQVVDYYNRHVLPDRIVEGVQPSLSKLMRAQPFLAACQTGKVKMLRARWNEDFFREFDDFPEGTYDDQVDCCSHGYNVTTGIQLTGGGWGSVFRNAAMPTGLEDVSPEQIKKMMLEQRRKAWLATRGNAYSGDPYADVSTGVVWGSMMGRSRFRSHPTRNRSTAFGTSNITPYSPLNRKPSKTSTTKAQAKDEPMKNPYTTIIEP